MSTTILLPRGIFSGIDNSDSSDDTCRSYAQDSEANPLVGTLTFHHLMLWVSIGAMGITCLTTGIITIGHLLTYRQPRIQKNLIRLVLTAPAYAVLCTVSLISYHATAYVTPWPSIYEAFALIGVMHLMVNMLTAGATSGYGAAPSITAKQQLSVYQLLPVRIILTIAVIIISAVDCLGGKARRHGLLATNILNSISTVLALMSLLRFLRVHIKDLKRLDSKIVGKLACFKLIVFVQMLQRVILSILSDANALNGTSTLSYNDLNLGLSPFLSTLEAMLISVVMVYYFWPSQFRQSQGNVEGGKYGVAVQKMGFFAALWDAINLTDVLTGIVRAIKARQDFPPMSGGQRPQGWYQPPMGPPPPPHYQMK